MASEMTAAGHGQLVRGGAPLAPATRRWTGGLWHWLVQARRTWRGQLISKLAMPLLTLTAMGVGIGSMVDDTGSGGLGGLSYLAFVAPGILATQAMWTATYESTYQVLGAIMWNRIYHGMLATPMGVGDVLLGHLAYATCSIAVGTIGFVAVGLLFGAWASWWTLLAIPVVVLTGLAFAVPIFAFAATQQTDVGFTLIFRLFATPLFLFSGVFFPVDQLPAWLEPVAWITPLWHGVAASRMLTTGAIDWLMLLGHVAVLLAYVVVAGILARHTFAKRLIT